MPVDTPESSVNPENPEAILQKVDPKLDPLSPFSPMRHAVFRMLWTTWFAANMTMWMNDVASAWMMTTLTSTPIWVALVQSASTLPVFLLGLPSGALADIIDRRRYLIFTQFWLAIVAIVLCVTIAMGGMTAPLLLGLTFLNGIGLAMRWPVFSSIVPELVPRQILPTALALNGVSMNASRIFGPLIAGALIASVGSEYVFILNAVLSVVSAFILIKWRRDHVPSPLGREKLGRAMKVGLQFVRQSERMRAVLIRIGIFFFYSTALIALLPLVARNLHAGDAGVFTLLLASMGAGAILSAMFLPRIRQAITRDQLVMTGCVIQSVSMVIVAVSPNATLASVAMFASGGAWLSVANSLSTSAQLCLPDWVRARGMSIYQMSIMGASAIGAAAWGQVATVSTVPTSLIAAAVVGAVAMFFGQRYVIDLSIEEDLTPAKTALPTAPEEFTHVTGRVIVNIEYLIDPSRATEFRALMQESRGSRLRQGALAWDLLHDVSNPSRFIEQVVDDSWNEHLRRFSRVTAYDVTIRERKLAFHLSENPPVVTRFISERET